MEKDSKYQEESRLRITGRKSRLSEGLLRDLYAIARGHIIQTRSDLFIGEDEAYIMNRKEEDKSVLRKEGNVYVLDLFVKVPSGAVAPIKYKPMEVDANRSSCRLKRAKEASHVRLQQPNFLTAGGVTVEDKVQTNRNRKTAIRCGERL